MAIKSKLKIKGKGLDSVIKSLNFLKQYRVVVGIPESANNRDEDGIGNAYIGAILDKGSPINNIPARPHLAEGVESVSERTASILGKASKLAIDNKNDDALKALEAAGTVASNGVKRYITEHEFAPLSPSTLHARKTRKVAKRRGEKPLIDTGEYRRAITHEVRKNET